MKRIAALVGILLTLTYSNVQADYGELWKLGAIDADYRGGNLCKKDSSVVIVWNVANFGGKEPPERIEKITKVLRVSEFASILEVSGSHEGSKAMAVLGDSLGRTGSEWDMRISDPTTAEPAGRNTVERYAAIWKTRKIAVSKNAALFSPLASEIAREPFVLHAIDRLRQKPFEIYVVHLRPKAPEAKAELAALANMVGRLRPTQKEAGTVIAGDFNLDKAKVSAAFSSYGFEAGVSGASTLNDKNVLAQKRDNVLFRNVNVCESGRIRTDKLFGVEAKKASDHLPVYFVIE